MGGNGLFGTFSGSHRHALPPFSSPRQRSLASLIGGGVDFLVLLVVVTGTLCHLSRLRGNGHLQV